ncbi:MAG: hypothetical protein AAGI54_07540 [Planctomycetota bacterium]
MSWLRCWRVGQWAVTLGLAMATAIGGLIAMAAVSDAVWSADGWRPASGGLARWSVLAAGVALPLVAVAFAMAWRWRLPRKAWVDTTTLTGPTKAPR